MPVPARNALIQLWRDPNQVLMPTPDGYALYSPTAANWWGSTAPAANQISISKNNDGGPVIFVWGNAANFAPLPIASILFIQEFEIDGGSPTLGLRIELGDWGRAAVLVRELGQIIDGNPQADLPDVVNLISELIGTVVPRGDLLSTGEVQGLYGELILFEELLDVADANSIGYQAVLDCWNGYIAPVPGQSFGARRDFTRQGTNTVIEVKTTGSPTRIHKISNYQQLIPDTPQEQIYLFSVAAKPDPGGNETLPHVVNRILARLSQAHSTVFRNYLSQWGSCGYRTEQENYYTNELFITSNFDNALFDLQTVDYFTGSPASFSTGIPPIHSSHYQYQLDLSTVAEVIPRETILLSLIQ